MEKDSYLTEADRLNDNLDTGSLMSFRRNLVGLVHGCKKFPSE